jgi:hypothetical protein
MNDLAANASAHGVSFALFHGNGQLYHPHRATEGVCDQTVDIHTELPTYLVQLSSKFV